MQFHYGDKTIAVNVATRDALKDAVTARWRAGDGFALATINLDHLAKLEVDPDFVTAYAAQDFVVADGWPIVSMTKLSGAPVELMPGSDMVEPLCRWAADAGIKVGFVGSRDQALEDAKEVLETRVRGLDVVYMHAPPMGFDPEGESAAKVLAALTEAGVGMCFLALGAPKQEQIAARGRALAPSVGFASIGAGLDFFGGHQVRAPKLARKLKVEWLWRALTSPKRMVPRYWRAGKLLPRHLMAARKQGRG